jgi:hypothetical protein
MSETTADEPITREMLHKRMDVEIAKLIGETSKLNAETSKLVAETGRINREAVAYPWLPIIAAIVGNAGLSGIIAAVVASVVVALHH